MKLDRTSLRSKVGRRIFMLFIVCALLPVVAMAYVSFTQVTDHLNEQSRSRLRQASKAAAMSIYERLLFLEADMKTIASVLATGTGRSIPGLSQRIGEDLRQRFVGLTLAAPAGASHALLGHIDHPPEITREERAHLGKGKTLVSSQLLADLRSRIFMSMALDPLMAPTEILLAEINPAYLWGISEQDSLPPMTELCVLDPSNRFLACSVAAPPSLPEQVAMHLRQSTSGQFEWEHAGEAYLASYWALPLKFRFFVPKWTVILSESKSHVLAPLTGFKKKFPLVILISLGVVLLLSISQIRKRLVPLERLQEGTRRVARREFDTPVTVTSGDEFEELAASFNAMARQLQKQFTTLATLSEIDRAILSALDTEKILAAVLFRIRDVFPCDRASAVLFDGDGGAGAWLYVRDGKPESGSQAETIALKPDEVEARWGTREAVWVVNEDPSHPLAPLFASGTKSLLVIPVYLSQRLSAIIALGYLHPPSVTEDDRLQARQLADQVAVAIHNSQLYEKTKRQAVELERANRVKDEFLSVVSHELRTPLSVIMGYAGMIREGLLGNLNSEQDKALEKVIHHAVDLLALINSIMEATQIEIGAARVESRELSLKGFLDSLQSLYNAPLSKDLALFWDYPADLPSVRIDSGKLKYILLQLINNAIKFTEKGHVTITARYLSLSRMLEFKVADTGIGIPKEALAIVFEKFRQVDSSERRAYGGVGLGLFVAKKFAYLLGGKVEVESEPGRGSTFTLLLPCEL